MKIRKAKIEDVIPIVELLANDKLGNLRESFQEPLPQVYYDAFEKINEDKNQTLVVVENEILEIIGTLQLSFIQYLTYQGGIRSQIEAVRVRQDYRGQGIGALLINWAIKTARERGAHLIQLTTDKKRPEAIRFYEKTGFNSTHEGMKLHFIK